MRVGVQQRGACAHHFAPLAAQMARSADLASSAVGRRQISCLGQSALAGRLSGAIHIEDQVMGSPLDPIPHQASPLWSVGEPADLSRCERT
jgi:hypothetical protein